MRRIILTLFMVIFLAGAVLPIPRQTAQAVNVTPGDLVALVNGLRTAYGLPALRENSILMSTAQWTAEEMARTGIHDHLSYHGYPAPKDRMAAAGFGGGNVVFGTENWAGGYSSITIDTIQGYWADSLHMLPMTDPNYQEIGAGVATDSEGFTIFIVHAAYYAGGTVYNTPIPGEVPTNEPIQYMEPVITVTPREDGAIIHRVAYGQTLFTLALSYDVSIEQIKALNNLTDNTIYVGQDIIIKTAPTPTITPSLTATRKYPTRTPTEKAKTATPTSIRTSTPTREPGLLESMPKIDRQWLGLGLLVVSAAGFFLVILFNFIKPGSKKSPPDEKPAVEQEPQKTAPKK